MIHGIGGLVIGSVLLSFPFFFDTDQFARVVIGAFAAIFILGGSMYIHSARKTPKDELILPARSAPPSIQISYFRFMLWSSVVAFPILTAFIAYQLHRLKSGLVPAVNIPKPAAMVYEYLGFWPAVLATPLLGLSCCIAFIWAMKKAKLQVENGSPAGG